jgi:hypothetical protein
MKSLFNEYSLPLCVQFWRAAVFFTSISRAYAYIFGKPLISPFDDTSTVVSLGYDDSFLVCKLLPTHFSLGGETPTVKM